MGELEKREAGAEREAMARWFDDSWFPRWWPDLWRSRVTERMQPMRVEEFEEDDALVVRAEMPGLDPEKDVEIDVTDETLRIRAERRQETRVEEKGGYRSEFRYGSFSRTLPLPAGSSRDDVMASYKDGILEVRVPIDRAKVETRKIPVQRS